MFNLQGKFSWVKKIVGFFRSVRAEIDKVSWPSQDEVVTMTILIIAMVVILSAYIGGFLDTVLREVVRELLSLSVS